ncbi:MAG: polysaccharide biosynthesis tyrosine autokinase, partial [Armatimonadota bacterium]
RTTSKNPIHTQSMERYISAKVEEAATQAQLDALEAVEVNTRAELASLPAKEAKMAQLDADLQAAKNTYSLMKNKLEEAKIREDQAQNELALRTIDSAFVTRVNQKQSLKLILALILSPILGIGVAFLLHYTDNTVRTAQDAEKLLELPVLSEIPRARAHSLPRQKCAEVLNVAHQMLTSNLWIASQDNGLNAITIVSAEPDAGRSVTASNLAVALAKEGAKVILVDCDFRKPSQHSIFEISNNIGISNLLSGGAVLEDVIIPTKIENLVIIPSGPMPDNPVKLLRSDEMQDFCDQIREVADFVVFDTPAGVAFPDPILVSAKVGAALMVQAAGKVPRGSEVDLRNKLQSIGVNVVGVVLTQVKREDSSGYFHYHRSYSGLPSASLPSKTSA